MTYYVYNADVHCEDCATKAKMTAPGAADSEGTPVHPSYPWDGMPPAGVWCGDCGDMIEAPWLPTEAQSRVSVFEAAGEWYFAILGTKAEVGQPRLNAGVWGPYDDEELATLAAVCELPVEW